ncbi:MAG TPA: hypothetical protein VN845_08625 [Solirubrobacteraceae bacterium]|nr:hypothetical protein [Solirubrobacteraceae bacterium]
MSDYIKELTTQVVKILSRDEARRQRIAAEFPQFAMDAAPDESSREFAVRVLAALGAPKVPTDADPLEMLDFYCAGRRMAMDQRAGVRRPTAMDGSGDTFIDKYIAGKFVGK